MIHFAIDSRLEFTTITFQDFQLVNESISFNGSALSILIGETDDFSISGPTWLGNSSGSAPGTIDFAFRLFPSPKIASAEGTRKRFLTSATLTSATSTIEPAREAIISTIETEREAITRLVRLSDGRCQITGTGNPASLYAIEASTDLRTWTEIGVAANELGVLTYTDRQSSPDAKRYYRIKQRG